MVKTAFDLEVFKLSYDLAMEIYKASRSFPKEEKYSLTDQLTRSSRSISANIAEGWAKELKRMNLKNIWFMRWDHWKKQKHGYALPGIVIILLPTFLIV